MSCAYKQRFTFTLASFHPPATHQLVTALSHSCCCSSRVEVSLFYQICNPPGQQQCAGCEVRLWAKNVAKQLHHCHCCCVSVRPLYACFI